MLFRVMLNVVSSVSFGPMFDESVALNLNVHGFTVMLSLVKVSDVVKLKLMQFLHVVWFRVKYSPVVFLSHRIVVVVSLSKSVMLSVKFIGLLPQGVSVAGGCLVVLSSFGTVPRKNRVWFSSVWLLWSVWLLIMLML